MLKISLGSGPRQPGRRRRLRCRVYPGQKVSRKYRMAVVRRMEYRKLQRLIPTIATRRRVPELTVILEAVKYIDELHSAIADRVKAFQSRQLSFQDRKPAAAGGGSDVIGITGEGRLSPGRGAGPSMSGSRSHPFPDKFAQFSVTKGTSYDRRSVNNSREPFKNNRGPSSSSSLLLFNSSASTSK